MVRYPDALFLAKFVYLTVMVGKEPPKVAVVVWGIAILFNPLIYGSSAGLSGASQRR
jgi:hypothetical protein